MNTGNITCFIPCRMGSERIPEKNVKPFAGHAFGLVEVKLRQVLAATQIDRVILSTNDIRIQEYAASLEDERLAVHSRSDALSLGSTSTDALIQHAGDLIPSGNILWTHVTSPFVTSDIYDAVITRYREKQSEGYDSLMTTTQQHGFFWQEGKPVNYDRSHEKWPRTQTLKPLHEVNSGAFLAPARIYRVLSDRIGTKPYYYDLDELTGHDIDYPDDFAIAECIAKMKLRDL